MAEGYYALGKHEYMRYANDRFPQYLYRLIEDPGFSRFESAIEFGAGMGRFSAPLVQRFRTVTLVEPAPDYASFLRQTFPQSHVQVAEIPARDFVEGQNKDRSHAVFCYHLMHHLPYPERQAIYRFVQQTNSVGVLVEPNPINPLILLQIALSPDMKFENEKQYLKLGRRRYLKELSENGLSIMHYRRFCVFPPFIGNALIQFMPDKALSAVEAAAPLLPFLAAYQLIVFRRI